jgi:hypothetical protein
MPLLLAAGARPGVPASATDDVELHYAATNTNWTEELVKQVGLYRMIKSVKA